MKLTRVIFALILVCLASGFAPAQDKNSNEKDKKTEQKPIEIKANVMVLDTADKYVDDIKQEDLKIFEDGVEQKITYFAKKEPILNLGLVIDNTGSMRTQLDKILSTGAVLAINLRPTDEAFLVRFVSSDKIETVQEWTSDKARLKAGLEQMYIEGGQSAITDALYLSATKMLEREKKDAAKRYALVLITDGEDRDSFYTLDKMLSLVEKTGIQIFVIALTRDLSDKKNDFTKVKNAKTNAEKYARTVALETGGNAYVLSDKYSDDDLLKILKSLVAELRSQYVVGYASTNQKRDNLPRKMTVQVADGAKGEKRKGVIRENFVVPKE
jgi:Ca-activated chloride channel family protein